MTYTEISAVKCTENRSGAQNARKYFLPSFLPFLLQPAGCSTAFFYLYSFLRSFIFFCLLQKFLSYSEC